MTPVPKAASATRRARASGPGAPPWAPAPEPERTIGSVPLPMAPTRSFSPRNGPGLRVPGDMATRPAVADPDGPATIPDFAELPGFPAPAAPSQPAFPSQPAATQRGLDFAAAPVPGDYAAPAAPAPGFSSLWDLAATDVFPALTGSDEDPGEPGGG